MIGEVKESYFLNYNNFFNIKSMLKPRGDDRELKKFWMNDLFYQKGISLK